MTVSSAGPRSPTGVSMNDWERFGQHPRYNVNSGPVRWLNGRPCQVLPGRRIQQRNKAWGFYTSHEVRYLDDQQPLIEIWPAAKLNKALRASLRKAGRND